MAPSFGMFVFYQFNYVQYLRRRSREIEELRTMVGLWEDGMTQAVEKIEEIAAAKQISDKKAKEEIARLRSIRGVITCIGS